MDVAVIDVVEVLNRQRLSGLLARVLVLAFLITLVFGFDLGLSTLVGPHLTWSWGQSGVNYTIWLLVSLSAGFLAPIIFGCLADRFGRRPVIVAAVFIFGLSMLAASTAISLQGFVITPVMRDTFALTGIAFAGILPVIVSLVNEFAPRRSRATLVTIVLTGLLVSEALRLLPSAILPPTDAMHIVFWTAALAPIPLALLLMFALPESPKYLALNPDRRDQLITVLQRIDDRLQIGGGTKFIFSGEHNKLQLTPSSLWQGPLATLTPLYLLLNFTVMLVFTEILEWMLSVLLASGLSSPQISLATILFALSGALGGLFMARLYDRLDLLPLPGLFIGAIPVVAIAGFLDLAPIIYITLGAVGWFCLLGLQLSIIATEADIYPTAIRAFGIGVNFGGARIGSGTTISLFAGPFFDLSLVLNLPNTLGMAVMPLLIGSIAALFMVSRYRRRTAYELEPAARE